MQIDVITLFPEMIENFFAFGVSERAQRASLVQLKTINPRDFTTDHYQSVDDRPYGGGPGMVMRYAPLKAAFNAIADARGQGFRIYLTPQGKPLTHALVASLATQPHLVLLCGRYEGVDERLIEEEINLEISLGDFVLSGGEIAAAALIDAVIRLLPGALGHAQSAQFDSFATGFLDHPHYTRPETVNGKTVPAVLLGGDHAHIARYRHQQALGNTWRKRPDLFAKKALSEADLCLLNDFLKQLKTRNHGD